MKLKVLSTRQMVVVPVEVLCAARALLSVFGIVGCPAQLRSDNGPCYTSAVMSQFLELANIDHHKVTTYNPKQNSIVERSNRQILHHARRRHDQGTSINLQGRSLLSIARRGFQSLQSVPHMPARTPGRAQINPTNFCHNVFFQEVIFQTFCRMA